MPKHDKIKKIHDLATVILRGGIDFSYGKISPNLINLINISLAKARGSGRTTFTVNSKYIERVEFSDVKSKKRKKSTSIHRTKSCKSEVFVF